MRQGKKQTKLFTSKLVLLVISLLDHYHLLEFEVLFLALINSLIATILIGSANARPLTFWEIVTIMGSSFTFTLILGLIAYVRVLKANSNFIKNLK